MSYKWCSAWSWSPASSDHCPSCSHSPQVDILLRISKWLTWLLTEQARIPETFCLRVMLSVLWFPERSLFSVSVCPSRVQLYWGLSPPSEEQDTLISPWDRHSKSIWGDDTGAGGTKMMFDMLTESWSSVTVSNTEQGRHCRIKSCLPWIDNCRVRFSKKLPLELCIVSV